MCNISCIGVPWTLIGDFNVIQSNEEKVRGNLRHSSSMDEFNNCIHQCGLVDMKMEEKQFSWCNGRQGLAQSWEKLDRILVNNCFISQFGGAVDQYLKRTTSDHASMIFQMMNMYVRYGPPPIRFDNMWTNHLDFANVVKVNWV